MKPTKSFTQKLTLALILTLAIPPFMVGLDLMVMGVAIEPLAHDLHIGISTLQWLLAGYAIGNASFYVIAGKLADMFGAKKIVNIGLVGFAIFSAGIALSDFAVLIIVLRVLQGMFGAFIVIGVLTWVNKSFETEKRTHAIGCVFSGTGMGMSLGPVIGGILIHYFSWRMVFWINVPIAVLGIICVSILLQRRERVHPEIHYDIPGLIFLVATMVSLTIILTQGNLWGWLSHYTLIAYVCFIVLFSIFICIEIFKRYTLMDADIFFSKNFINALGIGFCVYFVLIAWLFVFGIYLQGVYGFTPVQAGLSFLPFSILFFITSLSVGPLSKRFGRKLILILSLILMLVSLSILGFTHTTTAYWFMAIGFALMGIGFMAPTTILAPATTEHVKLQKAGVANGKMMMFRWLGGSLGASVIATVFEESGLHYVSKHIGEYTLLKGQSMFQMIKLSLLGTLHDKDLHARLSVSVYHQAHELLIHAFSFAMRSSMWSLFGVAVFAFCWAVFLLRL